MELILPDYVLYTLKNLNNNGYLAYLVGGCVRDYLMGIEPNDFDIATNAKPDEVVKLFDKVIETGIRHGTVTVLFDKNKVEVTTFRTEGEYINFRRPKEVLFINSLYEDLKRRDFTINAMAYNPTEGIIDYFEGQKDIEKKIIRTVGDPKERFIEDALRILRCIRFATKFNFSIEERTYNALIEKCNLLDFISRERIVDELKKIINDKNALIGLDLLNKTKIGQKITTYYEHIYNKIKNTQFIDIEKDYRLASFFSLLINKDLILSEMNKLKLDNDNKKKAITLSALLINQDEDEIIKRTYFSFGYYESSKIIKAVAILKNKHEIYERFIKLYKSNKLISKDNLKINGEILVKLGFRGRQIGKILENITDLILHEKLSNSEKEIIKYVNEKFKKGKK
ncbi:CCA tRNA nucleotidyltransferase [Caldicellulosiruptoraceae bacterium PP1]